MRGPVPRARRPARPARVAYWGGWAWLLAATAVHLGGTLQTRLALTLLAAGATVAAAALLRCMVLLWASPREWGVSVVVIAWPGATGTEMLRAAAGVDVVMPATLLAGALVMMELLAAVAYAGRRPSGRAGADAAAVDTTHRSQRKAPANGISQHVHNAVP